MNGQGQTLNNVTFVALDIETTGLSPFIDRIVEIGAVKFRNGKVLDTFQELIDPEMPISPGAMAVNGISDNMVVGKPTIGEVLPRFLSFLSEAVPVAHNAPFDVGFLSYDISRLNLTATEKPVLDTCAIPKRIFPSLYSYSLVNLAGALDIRSKEFHRALADARVCMEILIKCLAETGDPGRLTMTDVLAVNGPALRLSTGEVTFEGPFKPLQKALDSGNPMEILYQDARGAVTIRQITPLSVGLVRGITMIEAFCELRRGKRNFRLDRILEIK